MEAKTLINASQYAQRVTAPDAYVCTYLPKYLISMDVSRTRHVWHRMSCDGRGGRTGRATAMARFSPCLLLSLHDIILLLLVYTRKQGKYHTYT